jgi:hypothetical protein
MKNSLQGDRAASSFQPRRDLARSLLLAAGAVVLIFVLYEIAERMWLENADAGVLRALHMVRGIVASMVAAVLVGWLIARSSPPLLATSPSEEEWVRGDRPTEESRVANYARWLVLMRWVAVVVALTLVFISIWAARLLPSSLSVPLTLTLAVLAALNVGYTILLRVGFKRRMVLHIQVYGDLVILTVLLHFWWRRPEACCLACSPWPNGAMCWSTTRLRSSRISTKRMSPAMLPTSRCTSWLGWACTR